MARRAPRLPSVLALVVLPAAASWAFQDAVPLRITVLNDNTAHHPGCSADWGFACRVEGTKKTILFDAGTKAEVFAGNVGALNVDLSRVDAVVVSHPHGDHTGGLPVALKARPGLPVYLPFGSPRALAERLRSEGANVLSPEGPADVGPDALVIVTGCSHPGIVAILERAKQVAGGRILAVLGGFHLIEHSDEAVAGIVARFRELGVERVGATHCTGEKAIEAFRKAYGARFVEMGAGRVVELP